MKLDISHMYLVVLEFPGEADSSGSDLSEGYFGEDSPQDEHCKIMMPVNPPK